MAGRGQGGADSCDQSAHFLGARKGVSQARLLEMVAREDLGVMGDLLL